MIAGAASTEGIVATVVAAVPATIAAIAAWKNSKQARKQTTPTNGTRLSAMIEETRDDVKATQADLRGVKDDLSYHVTVQHGRGPGLEGD